MPAHVTPLPQEPSRLTPVRVGATEMVVLVGPVGGVLVEVGATEPLGTTPPVGPVRYQLAAGSPRHSPTVTALKPAANREVRT